MIETVTAIPTREDALKNLPSKIQEVLRSKEDWVPVDLVIVTQKMVDGYTMSVGDTNPIHTDRHYACQVLGLPGTVLPGVQALGCVTALFDRILREGNVDRHARIATGDIRIENVITLCDFEAAHLAVYARTPSWRPQQGRIFAKVEFHVVPAGEGVPTLVAPPVSGSMFLNFA